MPRPDNEAPLPPWWVEKHKVFCDIPGSHYAFQIWGGRRDDPRFICQISGMDFSNAKELADLIVQRTKQ